jgi:tetratricopeptide (TPR) repeat protein
MTRAMTIAGLLSLFLLPFGPGSLAADAKVSEAAVYNACMDLVRKSPEDGYEQALEWLGNDGGAPAWHCAAVGLLGLQKYPEAASSLEQLGDQLAQSRPDIAAGLYAQAGQAWTLADKISQAYAVQTAGLQLSPDDPDLLVDRAITNAALNNYKAAIDDLSRAAKLAPKRADVLTYRASAWRYLNDLKRARADADAAVALDPTYPDALLERGIIRRLAKDAKGARADWLQVVTLAPGTPAAEAAQINLEKLDVEIE